jgi:SAM-dependent methyltransferase
VREPGADLDGADLGDGVRTELLLHSLAALREIVLPVLDAVGARRIVEVGGEIGGFTEHLARRAARGGGHVLVVDPSPSEALETFARTADEVELVRTASPAALREVPPADAYVLDGDHNYVTVAGELDAIRSVAPDGALPLVVLHDVGWPCARRDQYYRPEALPPEAVHPHSYERGVSPDSPGLVDGGFSGAGEFAYASEEGGPRNGVLTAVDDFLEAHEGHRFVRVPCIFGLGILYRADAPYAGMLDALLSWCDENELLARLEANRVALYLRVNDVARDLDVARRQRDQAIAELESLRQEIRSVAGSRRLRLADAIPAPSRSGQRARLRDILCELADGTPPQGPDEDGEYPRRRAPGRT